MSLSARTLAIVGATGAVGREALEILAARGVPPERVRCFASTRSAGTHVPYGTESVAVGETDYESFEGVDIAIFCATSGVSKQFAPVALNAGAWVVDNSSAFRMDPAIPLVIPEVNGHLMGEVHRPGLVANPNCSTIIMLMALHPLKKRFGVRHITVSTYQAVSGAGAAAMAELRHQTGAVMSGGHAASKVFSEQCAFNVFSHNSAVDPHTGLNVEETKLIHETRKIWDDPSITITPTCIRVPVFRAHSESCTITLVEPASESQVRSAFEGFAGVAVMDDRAGNHFPTPLHAAGGDTVLVGRIRPDPAYPLDGSGKTRHWCLWCCGDQLRKGAAQNAIQIADLLQDAQPVAPAPLRKAVAR